LSDRDNSYPDGGNDREDTDEIVVVDVIEVKEQQRAGCPGGEPTSAANALDFCWCQNDPEHSEN
jgi:hypothetical protein